MFNKTIIIPKPYQNQLMDFGEVAESLLFFDNVNLYLKQQDLERMFKSVPVEFIRLLISDYRLNLYFTYNHLQIFQKPKGKYTQIGLGFVPPSIDKYQLIEEALKQNYGGKPNLTKITQEFSDKITTYIHPTNIVNDVLDDFLFSDYIKYGLSQIILNKEALKYLDIEFFRDEEKSYLYKLNFKNQMHFVDDNGSSVVFNSLLNPFVYAHEQMLLASQEQSCISTIPLVAQLMDFKTNSLIKSHLNLDNVRLFNECFIPNFKNIALKINNDPNSLKDFIKVLDKSKSLRNWIQTANQDTNLVNEFYKKISEDSWFEKLPTKGTRFLIFTGAGIVSDLLMTGGLGTAIGATLSAGDTFLLDKLLKRWSPSFQINQGVNAINIYINKK